MICANCGAENEVGRKFCLECGERLAAACPHCGSPNTPGARFCGECGKALAARAEAATPPASTAAATERRLVSVLFADLVGFTTLSEAQDAEEVRELLGKYFEISRSIVERYGGTVEKFIGDAVMAVWGTPIAQEDDAERAVRAALDLVNAVRRLGGDRGVHDLALRAAVHTGEAVVTIGATGMGMVAGDLVNTASRLQSVAAPGVVLVGDGTRRAASEAIVFEEAGEQSLKGKASPVPAYRALRVVAQRGGVGRSEGLEPPFVGRDSELGLIKDFYHATARDRGPRLVSVIGQAGIGKSRLAWEFLKYIDGVTEIVYWHQGRSPAYGEGISFWALGEMVRMRIGVGEGADETETREKLATTLDEFVTDAEERRSLEDPLLHLLGMAEGQNRDRGQLFVAWRTFFERIAEVGPVVMVFEDLQWADDGMLDFVEELVSWSRGRSIYVITLARPELLDRRPTWGAGQRSFTSLSLAPLEDEDMRSLLAGLVPGLPESVLARIVGRAAGIPLYSVETVRVLLNDGLIRRDGETFLPVGDLSELSVPESLHALIAARIDALAAAERSLVQDASVLGLSFNMQALEAVARPGPEDIPAMLQHLVRRELLTLDDDPRSPERGQYRFVQGLLREVAYGTLSRDDRRARHVAAARYYEALGDDELSGVLAQHYVDAYEAHPDGPGGAAVAAQARVALRAAAQRAADLGSHRLALGYLESALRVANDGADELELRFLARDAAFGAGALDAALAHGGRAVELADALDRPVDRRVGTARVANILLEGHQQRARELLMEALAEPGLTPDDPGYIQIAAVLARAEMRMLNDTRAVELADAALPQAQRAGDERLVLDLLITRAVSLVNLGRTTEAVVVLTGALDVANRRSINDMAGRAAVNLGYALASEDVATAFEVSRTALAQAFRDGHVFSIRYLLGNMVDSAIELGEWDWAMQETEDKEFLFVEPAERLWFGTFRTVIRAYRGESVEDDARRLYEESRAFDDPQFLTMGAYAAAVIAMLHGTPPDVMRLADEMVTNGISGVDAAVSFGARVAIWHGDLVTAKRMRSTFDISPPGRRTDAMRAGVDAGIATLDGRPRDARALYSEAQRTFRELGTVLWLGLTDLDIVITGAMEPDERRRAADEAREIFTRLRAKALLDRLDAAHLLGAPARRPRRGLRSARAPRRTCGPGPGGLARRR
ncbi:MAG: AAA family ATPase [Chloroflexi bacterium]|nr:AAA family ATPase [Chloroflexota bacterium]